MGASDMVVAADKLQPHNIDAEEAVLGSVLIDQDAMLDLGFLNSEDFFLARHGWIFQEMKELHKAGAGSDLVTLCDSLQRKGKLEDIGGAAYITSLINATPTAIHAEYYGKIVERTAILRSLIMAATDIAAMAYNYEGDNAGEAVNKALLAIGKVAQSIKATKEIHISGAVERYFNTLMGKSLDTIPTGLADLDKLLGGLHKQDLVVIPGRPGMGKTSLALSIMLQAARRFGKKTLAFSMEMGDESLVQRLSSSEMNISVQKIRNRQLADEQWQEHYANIESLAKLPIYIDDRAGQTVTDIRNTAIKLHAEQGLDLIIIDYIQIMGSVNSRGNRNDIIGEIALGLKNLARDLDLPVMALSQLSRDCEKRPDKRPMLSDMRDSGAIEANADVVLSVYRDEVYNPDTEFPNVAEIGVIKHRNGGTGIVSVYFKKELAQFVDLEVNKHSLDY